VDARPHCRHMRHGLVHRSTPSPLKHFPATCQHHSVLRNVFTFSLPEPKSEKNPLCGAAIAVSCFQGYVKDGDLTRGFPSYCKPFERHMELLESDSWEVSPN
jgi:hypothetical protein